MLAVTEHPEWETQPYDGSFQDGYGYHGSLADLFRPIGPRPDYHDRRTGRPPESSSG